MDNFQNYMSEINGCLVYGDSLVDIFQAYLSKAENKIIYAFLRKSIRITKAIEVLVKSGYEEEAQILVRSLLETKIVLDQFIGDAKKDPQEATLLMRDGIILNKAKALNAMNYEFRGFKIDKTEWQSATSEIRERYSDIEQFKKVRKYGYLRKPLADAANDTNNKDLYDGVYRLYSRNVHPMDVLEQFEPLLISNFSKYEELRFELVLSTTSACSLSIIEKCNEWLGCPISNIDNKKEKD